MAETPTVPNASSPISGLSNLFKKPNLPKTGADAVPQVPVGRIVSSPRRQIGQGRRDTILTGADGLTS